MKIRKKNGFFGVVYGEKWLREMGIDRGRGGE